MNFDKLLIIWMEQNQCSINHIKKFDTLAFDKKVFFSSKKLPNLESNCFISEFEDKGEVGDPYKIGDVFYRELIKLYL